MFSLAKRPRLTVACALITAVFAATGCSSGASRPNASATPLVTAINETATVGAPATAAASAAATPVTTATSTTSPAATSGTTSATNPFPLTVSSPVAKGGNATARAQTTAGASCTITYTTPAGSSSTAQGLTGKTADPSGNVAWSWTISAGTNPGIGRVRVTCAGQTATAPIVVQ